MNNVMTLLRRFFAGVLSFFLAMIPFSGHSEKKAEDVRLKAAIVSDVHIDSRLPLGQTALKTCYRDMNNLDPDCEVVLGDLTNYGDYATTERFFQITRDTVKEGLTPVVISGNHDIGHAKEAAGERMNPQALSDFVGLCNQYLDYGIETPYYTVKVNGYSFICLNDESADNWDHPEYSDAALAFLDGALAEATAEGLPAFVLIHVPLAGIHGEENYSPDGCTEEPWNTAIRTAMEKYKNVFCLSGHLHKGLSNDVSTPTFPEKNGVHYLNLPSFLMPNWPAEYAINGLGFVMDVTDTAVSFRCRNYYMHNWYSLFDYTAALV